MNRHAKAPSFGLRMRQRGRRAPLALAGALVLAFAVTLAFAGGASAATVDTHPYIGSFTPPAIATPHGPFQPTALAVNQTTGNLYVVDMENEVIDVFKGNGAYLNTIDGSDTPEGGFTFAKNFTIPTLIAIDNSGGPTNGRIYVGGNHGKTRASPGTIALSPSGDYLFSKPMRSGGLAVDSNGTLFTSGDSSLASDGSWIIGAYSDPESAIPSRQFTVESHTNVFGASTINLAGIDLDSHGNPYVVSNFPTKLARLGDPSGQALWAVGTSGGDNALAIDRSTDAVYAIEGVYSGLTEGKYPNPGTTYVSRYDTDGHLQESFGVSIASQGASSIAVAEASGEVYVADVSKGEVEVFGPKASTAAPDVAVGGVTELASAATTGSGDLTVFATGTGDIMTLSTTATNFTTDSGVFSVGESIAGGTIPTGSIITAIGSGILNFGGTAGSPTADAIGASLVSGSKTVTNFSPSSGAVAVGDAAYGPGIPAGTSVTAIGADTLTLSLGVTAAGAGVSVSTVDTTATLNGTINPQGAPAAARFQYRRHSSRLWTSSPLQNGGSGTSDVEVSEEITGLKQNTVYDVRLQGVNTATGAIEDSNTSTFATPGLARAILTIGPASPLAPTTAHLTGTVDPNGTDAKWHFEYATDDSFDDNWAKAGKDQIVSAGSGAAPVSADLSGLRPNTHYFARLIGENETGGPKASDEIEFTTPPAKPDVLPLAAGCLKQASVCLAGYVDPENSATVYYFEYGEDENYGSLMPVSQDGDAGSGFGPAKVSENISGLEAGATYHFRLVAHNSAGTTYGEDTPFKTRPDASQLAQIEGEWPTRGIELVNAPDKGNQAVYPLAHYEPWTSVSPDGSRVLWRTVNGGPDSSVGAEGTFLSTYTANGWVSRDVLPPASQLPGGGDDWYYAPSSFAPDFSLGIYLSARGLLYGKYHHYLIRVDDQQHVTPLVVREEVDPEAIYQNTATASGGRLVIGGGNVVSGGNEHSASPVGEFPLTLYEGNGTAVSVPLPACGYSQIIGDADPAKTWVNSDASRIFVYSSGEEDCEAPQAIYMIEPGSGAITRISGAQGAAARFIRANPAGSELLFSKGGDLYRWRDSGGEECLSCGSGFAISGGSPSADLSHLYFCGPPPPASPAPDYCAIYVWREAGVSFVAEQSEVKGLGDNPASPVVLQVSADGKQMIFKTTRPFVASADPTGWNGSSKGSTGGADATQLFHYDDDTGIVECVSCTDPPGGGLATPEIGVVANEPTLSADGRTIAFSTIAKLVPEDINGRIDVYEWHDGLVRLVTDGESEFQKSVGATPRPWGFSADGRSLFFSEGGVPITGNELDSFGNLYDARLGSPGFPPPSPPAHCAEDSCQGPLTPSPQLGGTASSSFAGPGNEVQAKAEKKRHHAHRRAHKRNGRHEKKRAGRHRHGATANHKRGGVK